MCKYTECINQLVIYLSVFRVKQRSDVDGFLCTDGLHRVHTCLCCWQDVITVKCLFAQAISAERHLSLTIFSQLAECEREETICMQ